jgi:predicted TPR repeat methyltransferase
MASPVFRSSGDLLADRRYDYAMAAKAEGDLVAAADLLVQALEIVPGWAAGWFSLGEIEAARGERAAAIAAFGRAAGEDPSDALGARLALARLGAGDAASAMTPAYVAALFDQYAPRFDEALRTKLAYRGPEILFDAVRRARAVQDQPLAFTRLLDLGCGTGLAADVFTTVAGAIEGVDLSRRMVEIARAKGRYRRLEVDDLSAFLGHEAEASADLILAADVFVYCAELRPILAESARILSPCGIVAFTVETHDGEGVVLGAGLRYAHAEPLVRALLAEAGLNVLVLERVSTRQEGDVPVPGLVAVAARP